MLYFCVSVSYANSWPTLSFKELEICVESCFCFFFPVILRHLRGNMNGRTGFTSQINCLLCLAENTSVKTYFNLHTILTIIPSLFAPPPLVVFLRRRLEGAAASSGDQVKGVCDGGGGEGQESHDLCAPAGGSLQYSTGFLPPTAARCGLQSGSRWPHWDIKQPFRRPE